MAERVRREMQGELRPFQEPHEDPPHVALVEHGAGGGAEDPGGHLTPAAPQRLRLALRLEVAEDRLELSAHVHRAPVPALGCVDAPIRDGAGQAHLPACKVQVGRLAVYREPPGAMVSSTNGQSSDQPVDGTTGEGERAYRSLVMGTSEQSRYPGAWPVWRPCIAPETPSTPCCIR
jgi:hypothetical protein